MKKNFFETETLRDQGLRSKDQGLIVDQQKNDCSISKNLGKIFLSKDIFFNVRI